MARRNTVSIPIDGLIQRFWVIDKDKVLPPMIHSSIPKFNLICFVSHVHH